MKLSTPLLVVLLTTLVATASEPDGVASVRRFKKADVITILLHEFKGRPAEPIKATVVDVLPNRMLKVAAHSQKDVRVSMQKSTLWSILSGQENFVTEIETHSFSLTGLVPVTKIAAENTVSSKEVFDLEITRQIVPPGKSLRDPMP